MTAIYTGLLLLVVFNIGFVGWRLERHLHGIHAEAVRQTVYLETLCEIVEGADDVAA